MVVNWFQVLHGPRHTCLEVPNQNGTYFSSTMVVNWFQVLHGLRHMFGSSEPKWNLFFKT